MSGAADALRQDLDADEPIPAERVHVEDVTFDGDRVTSEAEIDGETVAVKIDAPHDVDADVVGVFARALLDTPGRRAEGGDD